MQTDTNGDGILGQPGDVSFLTGSLHVAGTTDLGAYGTFISDVTVAMSGGQGTLSGEDILWYSSVGTSFASTGTFGCTGAICGLLGIVEGNVYPIAVYQAFVASTGVVSLPLVNLGFWDVSGSSILGSSMAVSGVVGTTGQPAAWYLFGPNNLGPAPVPEPGALALMLLGLGGLALRSRKA